MRSYWSREDSKSSVAGVLTIRAKDRNINPEEKQCDDGGDKAVQRESRD